MKLRVLAVLVGIFVGFSSVAAPTVLVNTIRPHFGTLSTCAAVREGGLEVDVLSGGAATGKRTKLCLCTSDGAAAYVWQNVATGTLGTSTTCGSE